jgi:HPt (histidine-containing phosphotransfer) domain-containing protein
VNLSVLDRATTAQLLDDLPPGVFAAILATFEADSARLLDVLETAEATHDTDGFLRAAHTLAGAAGAVGARELAMTARHGMAARTAEARAALLPQFRRDLQVAIAELRSLSAAAR